MTVTNILVYSKGHTNLLTFRRGGSSGYFSVCEKTKASWTAIKVGETAHVQRGTENHEVRAENKAPKIKQIESNLVLYFIFPYLYISLVAGK